jgi:H+-transporting ATPase
MQYDLASSAFHLRFQGSTDAARAAADIVLTEPGLSTIVHGILIARCIFERIRNFITYRIAATLQLLFFFFIAIFAFRPVDYEPEDQDDHYWPNFFHMPVIMLMLITLLNDGKNFPELFTLLSFDSHSFLTLHSANPLC